LAFELDLFLFIPKPLTRRNYFIEDAVPVQAINILYKLYKRPAFSRRVFCLSTNLPAKHRAGRLPKGMKQISKGCNYFFVTKRRYSNRRAFFIPKGLGMKNILKII
jgi:hypothetical protein